MRRAAVFSGGSSSATERPWLDLAAPCITRVRLCRSAVSTGAVRTVTATGMSRPMCADAGDHLVRQPDQVEVVNSNLSPRQRRPDPDAYGADGSITTTCTCSPNSGLCSASQLVTQLPERPGASASSKPRLIGRHRRSWSATGPTASSPSSRAANGHCGPGSHRRPAPPSASAPPATRWGSSDQSPVGGVVGDAVLGSDFRHRPVGAGDRLRHVLPQPGSEPRGRWDGCRALQQRAPRAGD